MVATSLFAAAVASLALADTSSPAQALPSGVAVSVARPSTPAQALLTDSYTVSLGTFLVGTNITANLNGEFVKNPAIDFNQTLGTGSDYTRSRADLLWRINPKHHVRFLYFRAQNAVTRTIDAPLDWGDYTFQTNSSVTTDTSFNVYQLAYEYTLMRRPNYEIAATAGVHVMDMKIKLSGNATVTDASGQTSTASYQTSQSNLPAPFPVIGLRAGWAVAPQWYLDAVAQFLKYNYEGFNGRWSDLRVGATWMFHRHYGVGVAYNRFHVNVDVNRASYNGNVTLGYSGAQAFLTGSF